MKSGDETKIEDLGDHSHLIDINKLKHGGECSREEEEICRICHLSSEDSSSPLIQLGCECKAELGLSHSLCAETWFKQRGNRCCEICGKTAKNITSVRPVSATITLTTHSYPLPEETSHRCKQSLCNILLTCFILALTLPWFFRINIRK